MIRLPIAVICMFFLGIFIPMTLLALKLEDNKISLSNSDKKKLDKADAITLKAENVNKEVDQIYSEIASKQAELTAEESDKLNNKALEKQIEVLKIKKEADEIRYAVYLAKCIEFGEKFTGSSSVISFAKSIETEAKIKYQSATEQYKEAFSTQDKLMSFSKTTTASDFMLLAVNNIKQAFDSYSTTPFDQQSAPEAVPTLSASVSDSLVQNIDTASSTSSISASTNTPEVQQIPPSDTASIDAKNQAVDAQVQDPIPAQASKDTISLAVIQSESPATASSQEITQPVLSADTIVNPKPVISEPVVQSQIAVDTIKKEEVVTKQEQPPSTVAEKPASQSNIYQAVQINEAMIDRFNKFLQTSYPKEYESLLMDYSSLNYTDVNSIKDAWYKYLYGNNATTEKSVSADTLRNFAVDTTKTITTDSASVALNSDAPVTTSVNEPAAGTTDVVENKGNVKIKNKETKIKKVKSSIIDTTGTSGFKYLLQIAASRVPLNKDMIHNISAELDKYNCEEKLERNWYKYSIGPYNSYFEAMQVRDNVRIKGSFVVAFVNGRKINANEALVKPDDNSSSFSNFNVAGNVEFKVQIAASRNELSHETIINIIQSEIPYVKSFEDGWNKYMIDCGNSYNKACYTVKTINVKGAFIAVYKNGVRINIRDINK
jgi:hypothetical protein